MKKNLYLGIACAVLIIAGGLYYFFTGGTASDSSASPQAGSPKAASNLTFSGSTIVEEQDGKKLWELSADIIEADPNGKTVYLTNLKGEFYQEKGGKIDIVAKQATLDSKTHQITMLGDIKATSSDGVVFMAPEARWSNDPKSFTGVGGVTLIRGDTIISGDKLETDDKMEKVKVYGNAKVVSGGKNQ